MPPAPTIPRITEERTAFSKAKRCLSPLKLCQYILAKGVIKVESTLLALELAAYNGGIALARPPATDILVRRLGLIPCLDGFSIVGSEAYHILHYANPSLTREAEAFKKWLMELH